MIEQWPDKSLVLGLGNPGDEYRSTRHNLGRDVVETLARRHRVQFSTGECRSLVATDGDLVLAVPETYMNRSGYAARCLVERRALDPRRILVVFDDFNLPLGSLRMRRKGGPGGQKGMSSVIESLRTTEIPRLRMGIAPESGMPEGAARIRFLLSRFSAEEQEIADEQVVRAADACEMWWSEGMDAAMNRFNSSI